MNAEQNGLTRKRRPRKMSAWSKEWKRLADDLVYGFAPPVKVCAHCGGPYLDGYICERCGSGTPEGDFNER